MTEPLKLWWSLRTTREQRMLLAMAAVIAVTLAWLAIVRPMDDALADARARHMRAVLDVARAEDQADRVRILERATPPPLTGSLVQTIETKATAAGFTKARVTANGGQASITIEAVRSQAFFGWITDLERRDGLVVERLTARTNADATLAVEATLRERRR
jgi:general secretion pathway protein M